MRKIFKEFKEFAIKGNMLDLAVGVIIGGAFSKIVTSVVNDIIMPILTIFTGKIDFRNLFVALDGKAYETLDAAKAVGAATINYGLFITVLLDFIIVAASIFVFIKLIGKLREKPEPEQTKPRRRCPFCFEEIHDETIRCPHCTSMLNNKTSQ